MGKFIEKNLGIILLAIISYFFIFYSKSFNETAKYNSDLISCARMKAYSNNKESSKVFEQKQLLLPGFRLN